MRGDRGRYDKLFDSGLNLASKKKTGGGEIRQAPVRGLPEGTWVSEGVYRIENARRLNEQYGGSVLGDPCCMDIMRRFGSNGNVVFLDLETTGLSGGTGTYAFLCGLGVTSGDSFKVIQYFLKSPAYEDQWLASVDSDIPAGATLATYNGRTFDVPMLLTRHVMKRSRPHWESSPHIDLLQISRRLYRGYLESCSLGSVEKNILGVKRSGVDVPGALIPGLYLQYLHLMDASFLKGVFYHNELDIVSLASLYCHVAHVLGGEAGDGRELLRAGDIWYSAGAHEQAFRLWNMAARDPAFRMEVSLRRARVCKKNKDHESAREYFTAALSEMKGRPSSTADCAAMLHILEELAKLEEHRFMSPVRALEHVKSALDRLRRDRHYGGRSNIEAARIFEHRRARLEKKIGVTRTGNG
jgi:uncharacterized protein YprB with RNaseH-like and TPR domain